MSNYKILVAHPGQQHSFHDALGLKKNGMLLQYITSIYDSPHSLSMKLAHLLVRGGDAKKILNRKMDGLDEHDVTQYYTFLSLSVIVLSRNKYTRKFSNWLDRWISRRFGEKVARYAIKHGADGVICFSTNEAECFQYLEKHAPKIKRIVDCANAPISFMKAICDADMKKFSHDELYNEVPSFWNEKVIDAYQVGLEKTDLFLAPSDFVRKGLMYCGVSEEKIQVVHYGSNFPIGMPQQEIPRKVKFIYVGQVTYRKGLHHLLRVFSNIKEAELTIVGAWKDDSDLLKQYGNCPNIRFYGHILHEKVGELLSESNVFVFPSLTEGFSLACAEALSYGLPLICTENSGINDVVDDGVNGFVYRSDDEEKLKEHIMFFIHNSDRIQQMSAAAIDTASILTWEQYGNRLSETITEYMKK